ncbi:hypothetical protein Bbelb_433120 [Branchiostoma belcheri]|nr:hypothetical protein Bbelb_433120 [Branchiostoma belcheri]
MNRATGTPQAVQTAPAAVNVQGNQQGTPPQRSSHMNRATGTPQAVQTAPAAVNVQGNQQGTPPQRSSHMNRATGTPQAVQTVNVQGNQQGTPPQRSADMSSPTGTPQAAQTAAADINAQSHQINQILSTQGTPPQRSADMNRATGTPQAAQTAAADMSAQRNQGTPRRKKEFDPKLVWYFEERGMTKASYKDPLVHEAAKETGKTVDQVKNFINNYRSKRKKEKKQTPPEGASGNMAAEASSSVEVDGVQHQEQLSLYLSSTKNRSFIRLWMVFSTKGRCIHLYVFTFEWAVLSRDLYVVQNQGQTSAETTTADSSGQDSASAARSTVRDQERKRKEKAQPVKRPADTSGGPPDKRPAGEGSSLDGHQQDELAQLREENRMLKAENEKLRDSEKLKSRMQDDLDGTEQPGPGRKPLVLLLNDEYGTRKGGISTVSRQIGCFLASKGAEVLCTVLNATQQDKDDAAKDGIQLVFPTKFNRDGRKAEISWLTFDHQTRYPYPDLPSHVDFIVGHVDVTSHAARRMKERFPGAKLIQVTHVMPEETSQFRGDEKMLSSGQESLSILDDLRDADVLNRGCTKISSCSYSPPRYPRRALRLKKLNSQYSVTNEDFVTQLCTGLLAQLSDCSLNSPSALRQNKSIRWLASAFSFAFTSLRSALKTSQFVMAVDTERKEVKAKLNSDASQRIDFIWRRADGELSEQSCAELQRKEVKAKLNP